MVSDLATAERELFDLKTKLARIDLELMYLADTALGSGLMSKYDQIAAAIDRKTDEVFRLRVDAAANAFHRTVRRPNPLEH